MKTVATIALAALLATAPAAQETRPGERAGSVPDDDAQLAIRTFRREYEAAATPSARAEAVRRLSEVAHPRIANGLAELARADDDAVARAALAGLTRQPYDARIAPFLRERLEVDRRKGRTGRVVTIARLLARYPSAETTGVLLRLLHHPDPHVVRAAATSLGEAGDRGAVHDLVLYLESLGPPAGGFDGRFFDEDRYQLAFPAVVGALRRLTGVDLRTESRWRAWYNANRHRYPDRYE